MAGPAYDCSASEETYFACTVSNGAKAVEICHDLDVARYAFGRRPGLNELQITQPVTQIGLIPWPGIGRTIWEEVTFENAGFQYTVFAVIERNLPEKENDEIVVTRSGGIVVMQGGDTVAELSCDAGSVDFPWGTGLFEAKLAAGQCFEPALREWQSCN